MNTVSDLQEATEMNRVSNVTVSFEGRGCALYQTHVSATVEQVSG